MFNSYVSLPVGSIPLLSHYYPINPTIIIIIIAILVGGFNHLEKYEFVNGKDYPYIMENKKCSKPPTRYTYVHISLYMYIYILSYIYATYHTRYNILNTGAM